MIGLVSESLKNVLEAEMPGTKTTLLSPADKSGVQKRVNLFLYRTEPNGYLNNRDWAEQGQPGTLTAPPLALRLYYLLTAYAPADAETGQADAQTVLANAMRALHDNPLPSQGRLEDGLRAGQVAISLHPANLEELTKIWSALDVDYHLSAVYEVSYVELPSSLQKPAPKPVRQTDLTITERRPALSDMAPASGPAGTEVVFTGAGLADWRATVRIGSAIAAQDARVADAHQFTVVVPKLRPGPHRVRAQVGNARLSGVFEVTA